MTMLRVVGGGGKVEVAVEPYPRVAIRTNGPGPFAVSSHRKTRSSYLDEEEALWQGMGSVDPNDDEEELRPFEHGMCGTKGGREWWRL